MDAPTPPWKACASFVSRWASTSKRRSTGGTTMADQTPEPQDPSRTVWPEPTTPGGYVSPPPPRPGEGREVPNPRVEGVSAKQDQLVKFSIGGVLFVAGAVAMLVL